ncbi:MAG: polysaccharide deacetylase family protein [Clostridium sp.]
MKKYVRRLIILLFTGIISINYIIPISVNADEQKIVYLTFDDGPSFSNTDSILDILDYNNVKATFCIVGNNAVRNKGTMRRIKNSGMGILPHCNNHDYKQIYSSEENYIDDLNKCMEIINSIIEENRTYNMVRMPGGSTNQVCKKEILDGIKHYLRQQNINYLDWSIDCGDTIKTVVSCNAIKENVENMCGRNKVEVILMHDLENKKSTTEALQDIIDTYKKLGYEFKTVEAMEPWEFDYLIEKKVINR